MFEKFGEFDSAEEINAKAAKLLAEGDMDGIRDLAAENGLMPEDAEDYMGGAFPQLATPVMAAEGKLTAEGKALDLGGILETWRMLILELCAGDRQMCTAVRKRGKNLKDCIAMLVKFSFENKVRVSDAIVDAVEVSRNGKTEPMRKPLYLGVPNNAQAKQLIRDYYLK